MRSESILIASIVIPERARGFQPMRIKSLADSIRDVGLQIPITVRMVGDVPHLIAGLHRIRACELLGQSSIEAMVFEDETTARLWEIDENLQRAELTALERSHHIAERARLLEKAEMTVMQPTEQKQDDKEQNKLAQVAPVSKGGRGKVSGNRNAGRSLDLSKDKVRRAKVIDNLSAAAKKEAVKLGLDRNQRALLYAAAHDTAELQIKALHSEAKRKVEKAERKAEAAKPIAEQAATTRAPVFEDPRRAKAQAFWLWLIEEHGEKAYAIVDRLRDLSITILVEEVDRARREGTETSPKLLH